MLDERTWDLGDGQGEDGVAMTAHATTRRTAGVGSRGRKRGPRRSARVVASALAVVAAVGAAAEGVHALRSHGSLAPDSCTVVALPGGAPLELAPAQAQDAAVIGAVALRRGLPDHAVTIAVAAALQETKLYNLPYGDRDSVGLFQQRPSQGWGTAAQLLDPVYATNAFYDALVRVRGWQSMAVTDAAQSVQHSAAPDAYAAWEPDARAIAVAVTGEEPAGLACHLRHLAGAAPAPAELTHAADEELGSGVLTAALDDKTGWRVATWAVAHASAYHIGSVTFAGRAWTARTGTWSANGPASGPTLGHVVIVPA
jgi:hypothetical protein